jgi:hypothetical protein
MRRKPTHRPPTRKKHISIRLISQREKIRPPYHQFKPRVPYAKPIFAYPMVCPRSIFSYSYAQGYGLSPEPVAKLPPLGLGATEMTEFLWPCNMSWVLPVLGSQNWTPRSFDPERTQFPSGVRATERTKSCHVLVLLENY